MSLPLEKIESDLLDLPREVRARLAEVLISSLAEQDEIDDAWDEEADRRYRQYLAGEIEMIPAEQALAEVRARLRR